MIFVTVGSDKFELLVKKIDEIAPKLKENVVVQIGRGNYIPKNCKWFRFSSEMKRYYKMGDLIISHGGSGTLFECLKLGKRVIAVPNFGSSGQHQLDLVEELARENYITMCGNLEELESYIKNNRKYKVYKQPKCTIAEDIKKFLDSSIRA
ncbi:MAG: beta-1,4-galactosyltransferase [Candidatus Aenigmarchaeota archaeon]|nr:beta-1,4-galactosyltransferase [Candidatus Aenigmarchaeota archaeon]